LSQILNELDASCSVENGRCLSICKEESENGKKNIINNNHNNVGLSKQTGDPRSHGEMGPFEVGHWHPTA